MCNLKGVGFMRKIISVALLLFIVYGCLFNLYGCVGNNMDSSHNNDFQYEFTEEGKIILYQDTPYYGFIDEDHRLCDSKNTAEEGIQKIKAVVQRYRTATDNSDFVIQDYLNGVSIVRYKGSNSTVEIPETLDGKPVIKIGGYIHNYESSSDPLYIYRPAFDCSEIKKIVLSKSIKEIVCNSFHTVCFSEDDSTDDILEEIEVDSENKYYSSHSGMLYSKDKSVLMCVPSNNRIKEVSIGSNTETAYDVISVNTVKLNIEESLKNIYSAEYDSLSDSKVMLKTASEVFDASQNTKLEEISVADDNTNFASEDGVIYNKDKTELIIFPYNKQTAEFKVPDSVKKVDGFCINNIKNLKTLVFGDKIEEISCYVFYSPDAAWDADMPALNTVKGCKNTVSEEWAKENSIKFVALD